MQSNQRMLYEKTRITMWMTALHSGQLAPMSATRRAQFSQNLAWPHGTKAKPSIGDNKLTSQHRGRGTAAAGAAGPVCQFPVRHFPVLQIPKSIINETIIIENTKEKNLNYSNYHLTDFQ